MGSMKPLGLLVIAGTVWLCAFPVAAKDDKSPEKTKPRPAAQGNDTAKAHPAGGAVTHPAPSPGAPEQHGNSGSERPSDGVSILMDILFGSGTQPDEPSSSSRSTSHLPSFLDFSITSTEDWFATYMGLGLGESTAYYPSNSSSHGAWKALVGARTNHIGVDFGVNNLSPISTTLNSQPVTVGADALSFSAVGYVPLARNTDLFLKYGGVYWSVTANRNTAGNYPVTSGTSRVLGAGFEIRDSKRQYFMRLEKEMFRDVYQSKFYTFTGLSLGFYD